MNNCLLIKSNSTSIHNFFIVYFFQFDFFWNFKRVWWLRCIMSHMFKYWKYFTLSLSFHVVLSTKCAPNIWKEYHSSVQMKKKQPPRRWGSTYTNRILVTVSNESRCCIPSPGIRKSKNLVHHLYSLHFRKPTVLGKGRIFSALIEWVAQLCGS